MGKKDNIKIKIRKKNKKEVNKDEKVYRIKTKMFFKVMEKNKEKGISKIIFTVCRIFRFLRIVAFLYKYPLIHPFFASKYSRCVNKLVKSEHIDKVISEYVPIEAVYAGIKAKESNKELDFKVYVVDTFTQCPNAINHRVIKTVSQKWEKKII